MFTDSLKKLIHWFDTKPIGSTGSHRFTLVQLHGRILPSPPVRPCVCLIGPKNEENESDGNRFFSPSTRGPKFKRRRIGDNKDRRPRILGPITIEGPRAAGQQPRKAHKDRARPPEAQFNTTKEALLLPLKKKEKEKEALLLRLSLSLKIKKPRYFDARGNKKQQASYHLYIVNFSV